MIVGAEPVEVADIDVEVVLKTGAEIVADVVMMVGLVGGVSDVAVKIGDPTVTGGKSEGAVSVDELVSIVADEELARTTGSTDDDGVRDDTTDDTDTVDINIEELELGGGEFVYKFSLSGPPQYSVWFPLQSVLQVAESDATIAPLPRVLPHQHSP